MLKRNTMVFINFAVAFFDVCATVCINITYPLKKKKKLAGDALMKLHPNLRSKEKLPQLFNKIQYILCIILRLNCFSNISFHT